MQGNVGILKDCSGPNAEIATAGSAMETLGIPSWLIGDIQGSATGAIDPAGRPTLKDEPIFGFLGGIKAGEDIEKGSGIHRSRPGEADVRIRQRDFERPAG